MLATRLCFVTTLFGLAGSVAALLPEDLEERGHRSGNLQGECSSRCPDLDLNQNRTDDASSEVGCGVRCKIDQCTKGCAAWQQALETSCQAVCNVTQELLPPKELYCVLGCHDALNRYFQQLKAEIGVPPAPALVADSLTATSLRLEWTGIDIEKRHAGGVSYLVQWRYEELAETWQYCRNQSWGQDDQILVENLQPYTKYRFRVAILLKSTQHNPEPIVSAPSVVILTLAAGRPTSAPVIVRAAAVDSCRVSVSWEPGPFPNGPLASYVLQLQGADYSLLTKDIPASENTDHYMFQNLVPNKNYTISVSMRNAEGAGPPAVIYITTPPEPAVKDMQQPILILGGEHVVTKQGADMLDEPRVVCRTAGSIRGVAIHVASAQLFFSDSMGFVYRTSIMESSEPTVVLSSSQVNFKPLSLSVDWLNMHLYVLGEVKHATTVWQIARCNFDGKGLTVAMAGFLTRPSHIEVDPYNGYLFWVTRGGLYRLDLADISNGIKHEVQPYLILEDAHLGAFTVDHTNFRLLVPDHTKNTVISVSLDGREILDLRANTQQPKFKNVVSLAMANGLFYWTNGEEVLTEGYHPGQNRYFHNAYPDRSDVSFVSVNVLMDASQPVPVPVNPPTGVQAVLGAERAKVSWQAPHLLGGQGKGAWQNWSYELEIKDESSGDVIRQTAIAGSSHTVHNLREKSEYTIKAAAYTSAGRGPWSTEFHGRTLKDGSHASILWSANEGLLRSDVTGENVETLIYKGSLRDSESEYYIVDVSWYQDTLYIVGNNSALYRYNMTEHSKTRLNINSVGSVAVDWISKKLYWANPKQQIITRANLNGSQQEPMSILAIVKELMIDAQAAYLYWSTGHAVEVARLNGQDRRYYHSDEIFNGKQVMGLTLDTENRYVYWIVRSYESGSIVYRAPTSERIPMSQKIVPEKVSSLQHPNMQGPLCYFSEHLLWLQDDRNTVIGDLTGQNTAVINGISLIGLHMVAIMDPALHRYPENLTADTIAVLPNAVKVDSIRVEGTWRNFNVSWDPVTNTNYGTVFYEVKFADYINTNSNPEITTETSMPYNNSDQILPYSILEVTIKAFTYWGTSGHSRTMLTSPQSVPSQPTNVRIFVEHNREPLGEENDLFVTFRWDLPQFVNGLIQGYELKCWSMMNGVEIQICNDVKVGAEVEEYSVHQLKPNTTYYLKVRAFTKVGAGPYTDVVNVSTDYENPVPQLLVATTDAVRMIDLDRRSNETITRHIVGEVRYLAVENKLFWINEMQEVVTSDMKGKNATKILSLNGTSSGLCLDWVSRSLYWSESTSRKNGASRIVKLDITAWEAGTLIYEQIITRTRSIVNLEVSPLTGELFWIELTEADRGMIMHSDLNGENVKIFFNHDEDCSCSYRPSLKPTMTIDSTDPKSPFVYWISLEGNLNIASIDGCECDVVLTPSYDRGLPPVSLTVDKMNVYWSSATGDGIYYANKLTPNDEDVRTFYLGNLRSIRATGKSLQPYPMSDCLIPHQVDYNCEEIGKTATSITIRLPMPEANYDCENYNLPSTLYTVYVSQCLENDPNKCNNNDKIQLRTYRREMLVKNLKPFTKYRFKLALSNYYSDAESLSLEFGPGVVLRTAAGAPTTPENVTVRALTPYLAAVNWLPPKQLNAAAVRYEVHWRSVRLVDGVRQKGEQFIKNAEIPTNGQFTAMLQPLLPGQDYLVYVRAYPAHFNDTYSESSEKIVTMYPEPANLTVTGVTVNALNVSWIPNPNLTVSYVLEYRSARLDKWQIANDRFLNANKVDFRIKGLLSKTFYTFRLVLRYPNYHQNFVWPTDSRFNFETLGDVPSPPGTPGVTKLRNSVYQLNWEPALAHGSQITLYRLEGKIIDDTIDDYEKNETKGWNVYYNGTDNYWIIMGEMNQKYKFRVRARNAYGFGDWSKPSPLVDLTDTTGTSLAGQQHLGLVLGLSVPVIAIMLLCFCYFLCAVYKQRKEGKKAVLPPIMPDLELATLREIPRGNFVQSNALYAPSLQHDHDDSMLPKIRREHITLAKFLGSGAFGEVFQGNAKDLEGPGITPVAIKTLRKGASAQEKTEFLQEAQLMSHFRHKHVLRLLGVCLDTDPPLLVLELMEAGDLLSYLRASRSLPPTDSRALLLQDLLAMCEDVARGCRYLEELHFVHRDLACRNCLVSARDRENRVVKIGDFGLARDIYKNDYYRKEGEGLLPVRWMAPESLVDGVFTSQSDVWAFGVLMWEITSLGQQPYPARTNLEVLHHVRAGGRLSKPLNCPPLLHQLMLRCWSTADTRPSFKLCLEHIISLRANTEDAALSPVHAGHYLTRRGNSWKSSSSDGSRDMQPLFQDSAAALLRSTNVPKYLEVLADNVSTENHAGEYEIPRSIHMSEEVIVDADQSVSLPEDETRKSMEPEIESETKVAFENVGEDRKNSLQERLSVTSLNISEGKKEALDNIEERNKTLDGMRVGKTSGNTIGKESSLLPLNERRKFGNSTIARRTLDNGSETSLEGMSSIGSSIGSLASTRPSSSLINSQQSLSLKNSNPTVSNGDTVNNDANVTKVPKLQVNHATLQNNRANIPLVINRVLLNLLGPSQTIEDGGNEIATYTNLNTTDVARVN
ncbi:proto-oncogene tyrosine-protein kinase ROS isoform X3 [Venturia canescens]|uniref:proto-oncogene tyrosine-protein kinase ROS isoform X3 n=1 Tax=Venturia canescens TaxID=32260 RepID=UPI001C9CE186|nr:proto-oncogene tyrosine-protein kinase ROS isoform X3 [Venturia canescens]